jgi:Zc3h12a-like Ribonuclease NYN domain
VTEVELIGEIIDGLKPREIVLFNVIISIAVPVLTFVLVRYILNMAADTDAVIVSNDNFRELINEKPEYKKVIEERILMYSFVNNK